MTLTLGLDTLLSNITTLCAGITGIRHAYNYDEWPDSPPGLYNKGQAGHFTGYPEEGAGWVYRLLGIDMDEFELVVPLYTVVLSAAQVKRSRGWVTAYFDSYPALFAANMQLSSGIVTGSAIYRGGRVVRSIPDWPGFDGYYILRHEVELHVKGHVEHSA